MTGIRAVVHQGIARPEQPPEGCEGRPVVITLLGEEADQQPPPGPEQSWDRLST